MTCFSDEKTVKKAEMKMRPSTALKKAPTTAAKFHYYLITCCCIFGSFSILYTRRYSILGVFLLLIGKKHTSLCIYSCVVNFLVVTFNICARFPTTLYSFRKVRLTLCVNSCLLGYVVRYYDLRVRVAVLIR